MRDLKECTEEVFRRGEQRIRERRRKRSRVLALCIPVCLIAAVWLVRDLPAMTLAEKTGGLPGAALGMSEEAEMMGCPYTAVKIQGAILPANHHGTVTDAVAVSEMFQAIQSLLAGADENGQDFCDCLPAESNGHYDLTESPGKPEGYTVTFTAKDGSEAVYRLSENALLDVSANKTVFLSDSQAAGLLAVLGILE